MGPHHECAVDLRLPPGVRVDPGVVDEDVEAAEDLFAAEEGLLEVCVGGHVHTEEGHVVPAVLFPHLVGGGVSILQSQVRYLWQILFTQISYPSGNVGNETFGAPL